MSLKLSAAGKLHREFLKEITNEPVEITRLHVALMKTSEDLHLALVTLVADKDGDITEHTIFENGEPPLTEDAVKFFYDTSIEGEITVSFVPTGTKFSKDEAELLELFAIDCLFYFERVGAAKRAEEASLRNYQTGMLNSGGFIRQVMMLLVQRHPSDYAAFGFNLRGFGQINRRFGRRAADEIMKRYTYIITGSIEPDEAIGHLGGDNFVAFIKKSREHEFLGFISEIYVPSPLDDTDMIRIGATVGIWDIERDDIDYGDIVDTAQIALQQAKNVMRQPVVRISEHMLNQISRQKEVIDKFDEAINNEEFVVYYQPKVNSRTNTLVGAEGLVRWMHKGEMISPGVFIPALEQSGEIVRLDKYMLEHICADIIRWKEAGLEPVPVSVNFSRRDLAEKSLAKSINNIVSESGVIKDLIQVEVTETTDLDEHGELAEFINQLYTYGIMTAIDDFGSGYSTLSTLREFQVHTLKIDRSFINTDDFSWKDEIILTDIIHMARELDIHVVTEGVEREDQLQFVNRAGCDVIQGYFYDRPLPVSDFEKRLKSKQY